MLRVSAQDFRNAYETFYDKFRNYLWPYNVLEDLANVEVDIYTDFFDKDHLQRGLSRLNKSIHDAVKDYEDEDLQKSYDKIVKLLDETDPEQMFYQLDRVEEVNPGEDKQIKSEPEESSEEDSESKQLSTEYKPNFGQEYEEGTGI